MAKSLIQHLEDNSLMILSEALADARAHGGPSLQNVSDEDLRVALYTVLLKIIDVLRERATGTSEGATSAPNRDVRSVFLQQAKALMDAIDSQSVYTTGHTQA